jgi:hypothetical protein
MKDNWSITEGDKNWWTLIMKRLVNMDSEKYNTIYIRTANLCLLSKYNSTYKSIIKTTQNANQVNF